MEVHYSAEINFEHAMSTLYDRTGKYVDTVANAMRLKNNE